MEWDFEITKLDLNEIAEGQRVYGEEFPSQNVLRTLLYFAINTRLDILYLGC